MINLVEPIISITAGGLAAKAILTLGRLLTKRKVEKRGKDILNTVYQRVRHTEEKLFYEVATERDIINLEAQVQGLYEVIEALLEINVDQALVLELLGELDREFKGLGVEFSTDSEGRISKLLFFVKDHVALREEVFVRFKVVYQTLEEIIDVIDGFEERMGVVEAKLDRLERVLARPVSGEGEVSRVELAGVVSTDLLGATDKIPAPLYTLVTDVLLAYVSGEVSFEDALSVLKELKKQSAIPFRSGVNKVVEREVYRFLVAVEGQLKVFEEERAGSFFPKPPHRGLRGEKSSSRRLVRE